MPGPFVAHRQFRSIVADACGQLDARPAVRCCGHGVDRVQREIQRHLPEQACVAGHRQRLVGLRDDLHQRSRFAQHQRQRVAHDVGEVAHFALALTVVGHA